MKKAFWACVALLVVSIVSGHGFSIFTMVSFALYALWKGGLLLAIGYLGYLAYSKKTNATSAKKSSSKTVVTTTPPHGPTTKV